MAKIEAVRPGGVFTSTLGEQPLSEILMGILRGNLSGSLVVDLGPPGPNRVHFKDGVPVAVDLPALGVSLSSILVGRGEIRPEQANSVMARARAEQSSESRIVEIERIVAEGALREGVRARARTELEKLFDAGPVPIAFHESAPVPADAELVVLQPLPIIFSGLIRARDRAVVEQFLGRFGKHRYRLAETYPRGVDPFEWGEHLEAAVLRLGDAPDTIAALEDAGLERPTSGAVLTALHLADMLEIHDPMVARRPNSATGAPSWPPQGGGEAPSFAHAQVRGALAQKLDGLREQSYAEILRVANDATTEQVSRAHASLVRRYEGTTQDVGVRALLTLLDEAKSALTEPAPAAAYRSALLDDGPRGKSVRRRIEAEPKILRAIDALTSGRVGEAEYWLDWAAALEPERAELRVFREVLVVAGAPGGRIRETADMVLPALMAAARGLDATERAWGAVACVEAARGDFVGARGRLDRLGLGAEAWRSWCSRLASGAQPR